MNQVQTSLVPLVFLVVLLSYGCDSAGEQSVGRDNNPRIDRPADEATTGLEGVFPSQVLLSGKEMTLAELIQASNESSSPGDLKFLIAEKIIRVAEHNLDVAIEALESIEDTEVRGAAEAAVVAAVANTDPERALSLTQSIATDRMGANYQNIFSKWLLTDPQSAMRRWDSIREDDAKGTARSLIIRQLALADPGQLIEGLEFTDDEAFKREGMRVALREIAKTDPMLLLGVLDEKGITGDARATALSGMINALDASYDKTKIVDWLVNQKPNEAQSIAISELVGKMPINDFDQINELLAQMPFNGFRERAMRNLAANIASVDGAEEGLDWALSLKDPHDQSSAVDQVLQSWIGRNPEECLEYLMAGEVSGIANLPKALEYWGRRDPKGVLSWLSEKGGTAEIGVSGAERALIPAARQDPRKTAEFLREYAGRRSEVEQVYAQVAASWVKLDSAEAKGWLNSLSASSGTPEIYKAMGESWAGFDADGAEEWLSSLPPGARRDSAVAGVVRAVAESDVELAVELALSIDDERVKDDVLSEVSESR